MIEIKITVATPDILCAAQIIADALKGKAQTAPADAIPAPYLVTDVQPAPAPIAPQPAPAPAPEKPKAKKATKKAEKAAEPAPVPAPAPAPAPAPQPAPVPAPAPVKEITLDMLTRAGAELVDKGFMNQVLAIMDEFKVPSLLDLPKTNFDACAAKFHELDPSVI